jgi:hypothetical protein
MVELSCSRIALSAAAILNALGCAAPLASPTESEPVSSSSSAITTPAQYFTAGPGQTIALTPASGYVCVLESVRGAFDDLNTPSVGVRAINGWYWLTAGVNTTASAACVAWSGAQLGPSSSAGAQVVANAGPNQSLTGYKIVDLDSAPGDACFLLGIQGDWLNNEREPSGLYGRVNGAWVYPSGGVQDFQVLSNGMGLTANAGCYALPSGAAFQQSAYTATYLGPQSVPLPNASTALCGLTGIQGGLDDFNDVAEIVQAADGSQTLQVNFDSPDQYLWATATCLPYPTPPSCSFSVQCDYGSGQSYIVGPYISAQCGSGGNKEQLQMSVGSNWQDVGNGVDGYLGLNGLAYSETQYRVCSGQVCSASFTSPNVANLCTASSGGAGGGGGGGGSAPGKPCGGHACLE